MTGVRRKALRIGAAVLLAAGVAACGDDDEPDASPDTTAGSTESTEASESEPQGEPIVVGAAVDRTAYLAAFDNALLQGVQMAIEQINSDGGVLGRPLELVAQDMEADPQAGVLAVQRLITDEEVVALINGVSSAATAASAPVAAQNETPMIVGSTPPADGGAAGEWVFSSLPPINLLAETRVNYLTTIDSVERVGVLVDPTPYSQAQALPELIRNAEGLELAGVGDYSPDVTDMRPQVTNLLNSDPDAIIQSNGGNPTVVTARALAEAGADIPLLTIDESPSTLAEALSSYSDIVFAGTGPLLYDALDENERTEALDTFMDAAADLDPTEVNLSYAGRGWDATFLLARAIERAGSTEGAAIRQALADLEPFEGTSATYDFPEEGGYGISSNPLRLARYTDNDTIEIVFDPEDQ